MLRSGWRGGTSALVSINAVALRRARLSTGMGDRSRVRVTFAPSWHLISHPRRVDWNVEPEYDTAAPDLLPSTDQHKWRMRDQISRAEKCKTGKFPTGKRRTRNAGMEKRRSGKRATKSTLWIGLKRRKISWASLYDIILGYTCSVWITLSVL